MTAGAPGLSCSHIDADLHASGPPFNTGSHPNSVSIQRGWNQREKANRTTTPSGYGCAYQPNWLDPQTTPAREMEVAYHQPIPPQTPKWMTVLRPVYDTVLISWASSGTCVITRQRCPHGKIWFKDCLLNSTGPPWQLPSPRNMLRWSSYPTSSLTFRTPIIPNYSQWKVIH